MYAAIRSPQFTARQTACLAASVLALATLSSIAVADDLFERLENTPFDPSEHAKVVGRFLPRGGGESSYEFGVDGSNGIGFLLTNRTGETLDFQVFFWNKRTRRQERTGRLTIVDGRQGGGYYQYRDDLYLNDISNLVVVAYVPRSNQERTRFQINRYGTKVESYGGEGPAPANSITYATMTLVGPLPVKARPPSTSLANLPAAINVGGWYQSNKGRVVIEQSGRNLRGVMYYPNGSTGTFEGRVVGDRIEMNWRHSSDQGYATLYIRNRGTQLDGFFVGQRSPRGDWHLHR